MKDGELRGVVLKKFYELRHQREVSLNEDIISIDPDNVTQLINISDQLAQHKLIDWQLLKSGFGVIGGFGNITATGVDVIEGTAPAPITITLNDHRISVSRSSNVQIGNSNIQDIQLRLDKLIAAIDHSNASEKEKTEAKSIFAAIASNPFVQSLLGGLMGGGS